LQSAPEEGAANEVGLKMDESAKQSPAVNFRVTRKSGKRNRKPAVRDLPIPISERINNLPAQLSSFLGRARECETIAAMLLDQGVRLLTLTGTGGVGKTRLALEAAGAIEQHWSDGVCFVPLAANQEPEQVLPSIAQALNLQTGNHPIFEMVQAFLRDKSFLLVLDNFEQVVQAASSLLALLTTCPGVSMLVTSREPLHVRGEQEFPVLPLTLPNVAHESVEELATNPAVTLFLHRAQAIKPDFQFTPENAQTIASICIHLEGIPLALELAAVRVKLLPPLALLSRLSHPLQVLTMGRRDAPQRHQTLRATIQWSYDLLTVEEQILFQRLSIFNGGCTLEAVEAIYTELDDKPTEILNGVASLLDKSLLQRREQENEEPRFQMLETIREFGLECLHASGELERVQQAHANYYMNWAEASRRILFGSNQGFLIRSYIQEQWNWRAVMRLVLQQQDKQAALRLGGGLSVFWLVWGYSFDQLYLIEGRDYLERALAVSEGSATTARAWALCTYGGIISLLRDMERGEAACREGLALARQLGDAQYIITGLWMLLLPLITRDDFKAARAAVEEAVSLARTHAGTFTDWGEEWLLGYSLHRAGYIALWQGRYDDARALLLETIERCGQIGELFFSLWSNLLIGAADFYEGKDDEARERLEQVMMLYKSLQLRTQIAEAQGYLGLIALRRGDSEGALTHLSESLQLRKAVGDEQAIAWAECWLARVERARGNLSEARLLLEDGLSRAIKAHSRLYTAMGLEEFGKIVAEQNESVWAAQILGTAAALREAMGAPMPPVEEPEYEKAIMLLHSILGEASFQAAWAEGRGMTPQQVFSGQKLPVNLPLTPEAIKVALTKRELDVLRLLAEGLSNAQIAERLTLSVITIKAYLRTLYKKLNVSSRTAAVRKAIEYKLLNDRS
jgi:predicted ATPase/DNA-binding CsgD family transcriptional regulator